MLGLEGPYGDRHRLFFLPGRDPYRLPKPACRGGDLSLAGGVNITPEAGNVRDAAAGEHAVAHRALSHV